MEEVSPNFFYFIFLLTALGRLYTITLFISIYESIWPSTPFYTTSIHILPPQPPLIIMIQLCRLFLKYIIIFTYRIYKIILLFADTTEEMSFGFFSSSLFKITLARTIITKTHIENLHPYLTFFIIILWWMFLLGFFFHPFLRTLL